MKASRFAVWLVLLLALGLPLMVAAWRWRDLSSEVVDLHARMPAAGGWSPASIRVQAGEDLHLRLSSDDVMHSFAIGQSSLPEIELYPGRAVETTLRFDHPGKYTFYCTRWCGADHWRMRGTIEVTGDADAQAAPEQPLYLTLGLDIDNPHLATILPGERPSAGRGAALGIQLPEKYLSQDYYRSHSPDQAWHDLRGEPLAQGLSDQLVWDLVALVWQSNTSPQSAEDAKTLYASNCAACHGESGAGDGVFAHQTSSQAADEGLHSAGTDGHALQAPANFRDAALMLGASPAVLQGKIVRGGMGTGMPYWGPIFTDDQIWALVSYIYNFQIDFEGEK
jgi:mono/diheme cytochrome c family protein